MLLQNNQLQFLLIFSIGAHFVHGSKILMITLAGTKSHKIPFLELGKGLSERGHNITFINAFPAEILDSMVEEINPTNLVLYVRNYTNWDLLGRKLRGKMPVTIVNAFKYGYQVCDAFLSDAETKLLMRQRDFDLLILDGAYPECAVGLAYHFEAPFIYINTAASYTESLSRAGNPTPYSITPFFGLAFSDNMNIFQRLTNSVYHIIASALHSANVQYFIHHILRKHIHPNIPNGYELSKNVSLIFQNGHFTVTYPRPFLPSVVEIACIHCRPARPLSADLEEFISEGNGTGFIYVSMGSSVKASNMPEELRMLFLSVFRSLPYQILWKWESADMTPMLDLPRNVLLNDWFPQQDLLGHPKIKAFVTHGGLLSLFEAVYHSVPVVAMPVFFDHDSNVEKSVLDGYAIRLELPDLTATKLHKSITTVVNDPRYKSNARKKSLLLKDQPEPPLTKAVFWTEYILRHKGGHHLQTPAKEMTFIRYYLIDVMLLALVLTYSILYISFVLLKLTSKLLFCRHNVKLKVN